MSIQLCPWLLARDHNDETCEWAGHKGDTTVSNTDDIRRFMVETGVPQVDLDTQPAEAPTWDTDALRRDFEVIGFAAPFVVVRRRSDGKKGSLEFTHSPRVYFGWTED